MAERAIARLLLILFAFSLGVSYGSQSTCPWVNAGTASTILGGPVSAAVDQVNQDHGSCEFVRQQDSSNYRLRVEVRTIRASSQEFASLTALCGSNVEHLTALGNEAVACTFRRKREHVCEGIIGRVRDHAFIIQISTKDRSASSDSIRQEARKVADQVAGNLF